jgi:hypothetical protein
MSSDEPTIGTTNPRRRILWLVVGHVMVGPMIAFVTCLAGWYPTVWRAAFIGVLFSQTSLLGIWVSLGASSWWRKLIGVVVGVSYLGLLLEFDPVDLDLETYTVVVLPTTCVVMPLLVVRFFRIALRLDSSPAGSMGRIQFSIRHLMILTLAVACLLAIGQSVERFAIRLDETLFGAALNQLDELVYEWLLPAVLGVLGVLPLWFVLATKQPVVFSVGLVFVGACAGYPVGRFYGDPKIIAMAVTATEMMAVVVSLLVVRSCGYRLVRLPARRISVAPDRQDRSGSEEKTA